MEENNKKEKFIVMDFDNVHELAPEMLYMPELPEKDELLITGIIRRSETSGPTKGTIEMDIRNGYKVGEYEFTIKRTSVRDEHTKEKIKVTVNKDELKRVFNKMAELINEDRP